MSSWYLTPQTETTGWHHRLTTQDDTTGWHHRITPQADPQADTIRGLRAKGHNYCKYLKTILYPRQTFLSYNILSKNKSISLCIPFKTQKSLGVGGLGGGRGPRKHQTKKPTSYFSVWKTSLQLCYWFQIKSYLWEVEWRYRIWW